MNQNIYDKHECVRQIDLKIERMLASEGTPLPAHHPGSARNAVVLEQPPLRITMSEERFRTYAAQSETRVGECLLERPDWRHVDIAIHGQRRLSYNVSSSGELVIYHFQPGAWMMKMFGVDPKGDSVAILPHLFADDKDPAWRAFRNSNLSKWPPRFDEE